MISDPHQSTAGNKINLPFKAIIFDMDGTLLESTEADYKAWERVFTSYNRPLTYQDYLPMLGIRSIDVIRNFLHFTNEDDVARILVEKFEHFADYVNEHPVLAVDGAADFLEQLSAFDIKIGLATSSRNQKAKLLLTRLHLIQYFDTIVTGEQVANSKPSPDIFLKAADQLQVSPAECVVVEDGPIGVAAAKNAGMKCIAITTTNTANKLDQADLIIDKYLSSDINKLLHTV